MKHTKLKAHARQQAGMTLLELTVVLLILIALAGMMIPSFDRSIVTSTENSTNVSSLAEVDKWMQSYNSIFMKEPNNMEALINGTAGAASNKDTNCNATNAPVNTVYCKMIQPGYFGPATVNMAGAVDEDKQRAQSLTLAGITHVYYNDPNTEDATFKSAIAGDPTRIDDGTVHTLAKVVLPAGGAVTEAYLATVFGTTADKFDVTCYDYVAFGIGNGSSLTGKLMSSAPIQYIANSDAGPALKYNRFVAIYQVDKLASKVGKGTSNSGCSEGTESARYVGSVIAGDRYAGRLMGLVQTQGQTHNNILN